MKTFQISRMVYIISVRQYLKFCRTFGGGDKYSDAGNAVMLTAVAMATMDSNQRCIHYTFILLYFPTGTQGPFGVSVIHTIRYTVGLCIH
jgi:hypothetical protein